MTVLSKRPVEQIAAVGRSKKSVNGIIEHEHRTKMLQQHQARIQSLRQQYGYLGSDDTVDALHWLALAFQAVPSLAKWAASKTVDGRKPGPVALKKLVMDWLCQDVNSKARGEVYTRISEG